MNNMFMKHPYDKRMNNEEIYGEKLVALKRMLIKKNHSNVIFRLFFIVKQMEQWWIKKTKENIAISLISN